MTIAPTSGLDAGDYALDFLAIYDDGVKTRQTSTIKSYNVKIPCDADAVIAATLPTTTSYDYNVAGTDLVIPLDFYTATPGNCVGSP